MIHVIHVILCFLAYLLTGLLLVGTMLRLGHVEDEGGEEILAVFAWPVVVAIYSFMGVALAIGWALEKISGKKSTIAKTLKDLE